MSPTIPMQCQEVPARCSNGYRNEISFIAPSLSRKFIAEFSPTRTRAGIRRAMEIIDLEISGAPADKITDMVEKFLKPTSAARQIPLTDEELAKFRADNGWEDTATALEALEVDTPATSDTVISSDGRYVIAVSYTHLTLPTKA